MEAEYDYDDGRMVYEVEFHVKGTEYDYEIDAQTGEVVKYKTEQNGANTGSSTNTSSFIGESAAKQAALSHAGVSESSTKYCNAWLEYDDGRAECYEVEFMAGNTRYEYKIALTSATVLESERRATAAPEAPDNPPARAAAKPAAAPALPPPTSVRKRPSPSPSTTQGSAPARPPR